MRSASPAAPKSLRRNERNPRSPPGGPGRYGGIRLRLFRPTPAILTYALRRQIDDHLDSHPKLKDQRALLASIPGIGGKLSLWFLALFCGRSFASARQAAAFLGLVPVEYQSGSSVLKRPRLSKAGDARWRARLFMPAIVAARWNPLVRAQYQRLLTAGKSKMNALGAAMRKLVHIAFGVLKHNRPFDPNVAA
jgi:transposase